MKYRHQEKPCTYSLHFEQLKRTDVAFSIPPLDSPLLTFTQQDRIGITAIVLVSFLTSSPAENCYVVPRNTKLTVEHDHATGVTSAFLNSSVLAVRSKADNDGAFSPKFIHFQKHPFSLVEYIVFMLSQIRARLAGKYQKFVFKLIRISVGRAWCLVIVVRKCKIIMISYTVSDMSHFTSSNQRLRKCVRQNSIRTQSPYKKMEGRPMQSAHDEISKSPGCTQRPGPSCSKAG